MHAHTQMYIVDVNYFPSYHGVADFNRMLANFIRKAVDMPRMVNRLQ